MPGGASERNGAGPFLVRALEKVLQGGEVSMA